MAPRSIPPAVRSAVLLEAAYRCGNPRCRHILTLELHHIVWVRDGGGNGPENLIALCPNCHSLHTAGHIPSEAIYAWKALLVSLNNPPRGAADLLLVLYQEEERLRKEGYEPVRRTSVPPPFRFTGDGLGILAGLMTSGLVEIDRRFSGASSWGGGMPSFTVWLTKRGRAMVTAWLAGLPGRVEAALRQTDPPDAAG
jgi:hypothetical protein